MEVGHASWQGEGIVGKGREVLGWKEEGRGVLCV